MPIPQEIALIASSVTRRYGLYQCQLCANDLRNTFVRHGIHGQVLCLTTFGGRGFIVMKDPNFHLPFLMQPGEDAIASSGVHYGVQVGSQVFDNIFRDGIDRTKWEHQFDCDVHYFFPVKSSPF